MVMSVKHALHVSSIPYLNVFSQTRNLSEVRPSDRVLTSEIFVI